MAARAGVARALQCAAGSALMSAIEASRTTRSPRPTRPPCHGLGVTPRGHTAGLERDGRAYPDERHSHPAAGVPGFAGWADGRARPLLCSHASPPPDRRPRAARRALSLAARSAPRCSREGCTLPALPRRHARARQGGCVMRSLARTRVAARSPRRPPLRAARRTRSSPARPPRRRRGLDPPGARRRAGRTRARPPPALARTPPSATPLPPGRRAAHRAAGRAAALAHRCGRRAKEQPRASTWLG